MTTHVAKLALEYWRASGERTQTRLLDLVEHFAETNGESGDIAHHEQSAIDAVREYEWQSSAQRLLIGAAGGGKSLTAKAIAIALKSKIIGKSNQRTAVWVDESDEIDETLS